MKRSYSLKKNRDFQTVYRNSKARSSKNLVLFVWKRKSDKLPAKESGDLTNVGKEKARAYDLSNCRIGISISKKVGGAVVRNRLKRQIKAIVRPYLNNIDPNLDIIILVRPGLAKRSYQEIERELLRLMERQKLII